ncbi:hypothetical protein [Malikia spinosa]|nr:hypothetical protein [Malikia spinosa]
MKDAETIKSLGGPTAVARLLGLEMPDGSRRVHNWIKRGIPAAIKVKHPEIFLKAYDHPSAFSDVMPLHPTPAGSDIETAAAGKGA